MILKHWKTIAVAACLAAGSSTPALAGDDAEDDRPNILFVMADDLNDFIGVMNNSTGVKTPNIDRLAANATIFMNAHSNAPVCSPSRASLFSGILPHRSGQYAFTNWRQNPVLKDSRTIMEQLSRAGYFSAGAGKLIHHQWPKAWDDYAIRPDYTPLAYDGEETTGHPDGPAPYNNEIGPLDSTFIRLSKVPHVKPSIDAPGYQGWWYGGFQKPFRYESESDRDPLPDEMYAEWAADKILEWDREGLDKPFLMTVGFIRPHTPLVAPDRFFDMYPEEQIVLPDMPEGDEDDTWFERLHEPGKSKGKTHYETLMESFDSKDAALRRYYQAYLASISFMDEQLGVVLDALDDSRFKDNTIVIFTSDHGYNLGEKENLFKNNLWERSTKVPLIIFDPRRPVQQRVHEAVSLIDLYPTLTELAGADNNNGKGENSLGIDGNSLVSLMQGNDSSDRHALTVVAHGTEGDTTNFALRTLNWRYVRYSNGKEELYDHRVDPDEFTNLADRRESRTMKKRLKAQLVALTKGAK